MRIMIIIIMYLYKIYVKFVFTLLQEDSMASDYNGEWNGFRTNIAIVKLSDNRFCYTSANWRTNLMFLFICPVSALMNLLLRDGSRVKATVSKVYYPID